MWLPPGKLLAIVLAWSAWRTQPMATRAPSSAKVLTMPAPMPLEPPVTKARLPARRPLILVSPCSSRRIAAIDGDRLSGDERRRVARQIDSQLAHLLQLAGARDRVHAPLGFQHRLRVGLQLHHLMSEGRLDKAGAHRIDPHALVGEIKGGGFHQPDDAVLASAIAGAL